MENLSQIFMTNLKQHFRLVENDVDKLEKNGYNKIEF
jgi:hypothetical protein